jgi:methionyl-tRNA formyltransferase
MENKIKIGYFADGAWSHRAFEKIVEDPSIEILFIVPRTDTKDTTLYKYSKKYNIPYHKNIKINSDFFFSIIKKYNCDLFVSMSFDQIFKQKIYKYPKLGTINCHAGKLPFYRGRNILNWALINDEKEFGITIHYIDDGIDTGDIILQRTYPINDNDNYKTILETAYTGCSSILYDALKLIQMGNLSLIKQSTIHPVGFYCGPRGLGDEIINWNQSSRQLFNFIRAICSPGPKATTFFNGKTIKINKARMIENSPNFIGTVGQIIGKTKDGYIIKVLDTTIEILEIEATIKLKVGDKLGSRKL